MKAINEKFTQIDSSISELKQISHQLIQEHITSTDNGDVEMKSESENISIDVKDIELKSPSDNILTQGDASISESVFDLDNFLNSQQTTILKPSTKPEMSTNDAESASITTPSNTQTSNDSESFNLCDFSIESEPSLEAKNESSIKQESDLSIYGTDDHIEDKLSDNAMDQSNENGKEMVCDSIEGLCFYSSSFKNL